jgi:hypothetical protein
MHSLFEETTPVVPPPESGLDVPEELALKLFGGSTARAQDEAMRFVMEANDVASRRAALACVTVHSSDVSSQDAAEEIMEVAPSLPPFSPLISMQRASTIK